MSAPPFQRLVDEHGAALLRFLVASVGSDRAEDCLQEALLAALRAYPPRDAENLRGWLFTIAHRKALDAHRARARAALPVGEPHEVAVEDARRDDGLWGRVAALPARQREVVALRFVADLPHRDVAAALGTTETAVRRALSDALSALRREP